VARILSPKYIAFFRLSRINNFSGISLRPHKNSSGRKIVAHISGARRVLSIADSFFLNKIPSAAALNVTQRVEIKIIRRTTSNGLAPRRGGRRRPPNGKLKNEILRPA